MESRTLVRGGDVPAFFEITWEETQVEIAEGPLGSEGEVDLRTFVSRDEAREFVEEQLARRQAQGYAAAELRPAKALHPQNPELEAAILADLEAVEPYLVYADWLQSEGDPRGELIMLQHALAEREEPTTRAAEQKLLADNARRLLGDLAETPELAELEFRLGFIRRACLFVEEPRSYDFDGPALLGSVLRHPSFRFLRQLTVWRPGGWDLDDLLRGLLAAGSLSCLSRLQIGLPGDSGRRWVPAGDLLRQCPLVEELCIFGGPLELETGGHHPQLRQLLLQARLDGALLSTVRGMKLPALERLDLTHKDWGSTNFDLEALAGLLQPARWPKLCELALRCDDSEIAGELCNLLVGSPVLAQLRSVELSLPHGVEETAMQPLIEAAALLRGLRPLRFSGAGAPPDSVLRQLRAAGIAVELGPEQLFQDCHLVRRLPEDDDDDDYDDEEGEEGEDWYTDEGDEVKIVDYDLGVETEEPEESTDDDEDEEGTGADKDWDNRKEDPYDVDDEA